MAAPANQVNSDAMNVALDQFFLNKFQQDADRLAEILGIFGTETMAVGVVINQLKITGSLNDEAGEDGSSGEGYVEGDLVALSKFQAQKVAVDTVKAIPYRKQTTAQAILSGGYEAAVLKTDQKMLAKVRAAIISKFFAYLENGTTTASGANLQKTLAKVDAALGNALESNDDEASRIVHFISRDDAADYLGEATITDQTVFGMTYLQNFLGVTDVFLTNKVEAGKVYATPVENLRIYGLDFASLSTAGISYAQLDDGLIGVAHTPAYDHVSADTNVLCGTTLLAEVTDYIVKGTIAAA